MASIIPGYEYDVFISYRHKDNKRDGWVSEFVRILKDELEATLKEDVNVYFDENQNDGLLETHDVDKSLAKKLKCLIFIPIVSQTYCDTNSFAWKNELVPFIELAGKDQFNLNLSLHNGNVASRVLPIRIHDLDNEDKSLFEMVVGSRMRPIDFIYKTKGVNRPLKPEDEISNNEYNTIYRDQINKVANGVKELINALVNPVVEGDYLEADEIKEEDHTLTFWQLIRKRNIPRAGFFYIIMAWLTLQLCELVINYFHWPQWTEKVVLGVLIVGLPISSLLAWLYERSPNGFVRTNSQAAKENTYSSMQKKPPASYAIMAIIVVISSLLSIYSSRNGKSNVVTNDTVSIAVIPFRNNTGNEEHKHFGLGFANAVRSELSSSKQFEFISALEATTKYWNQFIPPSQIADELGVHFLLTGMYETGGEQIRVSVELVDAATGEGVWNFVFNDRFDDIFDIQSNIAKEVLNQFNVKAKTISDGYQTSNIDAYSHYLKGLDFIQNFETESQWSAFNQFSEAVRLDSSYEDAWIGMIEAKSQVAFNARQINLEFSLSLADEVSELVNKFDDRFPNNWKSNLVHGVYHYHALRELQNGLKYFEKALEYDEDNFDANSFLGFIYKRQLKSEKALQYFANAIELKPNDGALWNEIGEVFLSRGEYIKAIQFYKKASSLGIDNSYFQRIAYSNLGQPFPGDSINNFNLYDISRHYYKRDFKQVIALLNNYEIDETNKTVWKMWSYFYMNELDSAKKYANQLDTSIQLNKSYQLAIFGDNTALDFYQESINKFLGNKEEDLLALCDHYRNLIEINVILGNYDEATSTLLKLNKDFPEYGGYGYIKNDPGFDKVKRDHEPFKEALRKLKMPKPISIPQLFNQ